MLIIQDPHVRKSASYSFILFGLFLHKYAFRASHNRTNCEEK